MSSIPSAGRTSAAFLDTDYDTHAPPYLDYLPPTKDGRVPSPPFIYRPYRPRTSSMGENISGHTSQQNGSLEPLLASPHNGYRISQKIHQPCLTNLLVHPLFTIRQKPPETIDWTPFFVRGSKTTPIHPETSVTKKIIQDLSLGYVPCCYGVTCLNIIFLLRFEIYLMHGLISQARHLLYNNTGVSLSLPATFTYAIMTTSLLSIELSRNSHKCGPVFMDSRCWALSRILYVFRQKKSQL